MKKITRTDSKDCIVIANSLRNLWPSFFLIALFCLAVIVRLDFLPQWLEYPDKAFYGGEPLLPSVDGYYYLSLSQDLLDGKYQTVNELRGIPDSPLRPSLPPLLSWLAYMIARFSGLSLNWIAMLFPALLGSLIIFPVYAYGKKFNGRFMGVSSALFAVLSYGYVLRTRGGVFDTDCLIISLLLSIGYFFWNFGTAEKRHTRIGHFAAALFSVLLFYLWWEQTPDVVFAISATFCCIALLFFYRPPFREGCVFYGLLFATVLLIPVFLGFEVYAEIFGKIGAMFNYISSEGGTLYPNISGSIAEQQAYTFEKVIENTTVTIYIFVLSCSGFLGLLIKRKKECTVLSVPFALGLLGVFYASRFLIFLTPVLALGLGFFLSEFWDSSKKSYRGIGGTLFVLLAISYHFHVTNNIETWPFANRNDVHALVQVKKNTPDDAVVWSTWGKGYLINYWARRATISDGAIHSGQLSHHLYWPLAQEDMRFAANFIKFFSVRGQKGIADFRRRIGLSEQNALGRIKNILSESSSNARVLCEKLTVSYGKYEEQGASDWFSFFFPTLQRPIYLFLHQRMFFSTWWYWYGTWDVKKKEGVQANYALYSNVMFRDDDTLLTVWGKHLDLQSGDFSGKQLTAVYDIKNGEKISRSFVDGEGIVYVKRSFAAAVLMDEELWGAVFNRLFVRYSADYQYFSPFYADGFNAQVWQVR